MKEQRCEFPFLTTATTPKVLSMHQSTANTLAVLAAASQSPAVPSLATAFEIVR